jgi:hypothetical protein
MSALGKAGHRVYKDAWERKYERLQGLKALLDTHYLVQTAELEYVRALEQKIKAAELRIREGR